MKNNILIILYYFLTLLIIIESHEIINNIYINNNATQNGNGTITNPFQSLCDLINNKYNILNSNTIINLSYGYYNSNSCIFEINNLNNILFLPYPNSNNNKNNNNNNNIHNNNNLVQINNISLNIINSNNININNINFNFIIYNENQVEINNNLYILNSTIIEFNNNQLNFSSSSTQTIINSSILFNNLNLNKIIFNSDKNLIFIVNNSNLLINNKSIIYGLGFQEKQFNLTIIESKLINCNINLYNNSNLIVNNTKIQSNNLESIEPFLKSIDSEKTITTNFNNLIISNYKNLESILHFSKNSINSLNNIKFINNSFTSLIKISPTILLNNFLINNQSIFKINKINLLNNSNFKFIELSNHLFNQIEINEISTKTLTNTNCDNNILLSSIIEEQQLKFENNIKISNSNFNCFGSINLKKSNIQLENIKTLTTFVNDFIILRDQSFLKLNSSLYTISNFETFNYLFKLNDNSTLEIISTVFINSSSSIILSNNSDIIIDNSTFKNLNFNNCPLISINSSNLIISNSIFNEIKSSFSTLISSLLSNIELLSIKMNSNLFGTKEYFKLNQTNILIDNLEMTECISGSTSFFKIIGELNYRFSNYFNNFTITNSIFKLNHGLESISNQLFTFEGYTNIISILDCSFFENYFSLLLNLNAIEIELNNIEFSNNIGAFLYARGVNALVNNFILKDNTIPIDYLFTFKEIQKVVMQNIEFSNNYFNQYLIYSNYQNYLPLTSFIIFTNMTFNNNLISSYNDNNNTQYPFPFNPNNEPTHSIITPSQIIVLNMYVHLKNFEIIDNKFTSVSMFYFENTFITIEDCNFSSNQFKEINSTKLLKSYKGEISITNTTIENNGLIPTFQDTIKRSLTKDNGYVPLLHLIDIDYVSIQNCSMNKNIFPYSKGGVIGFDYYFKDSINSNFSISIYSSNFKSNIGNFGGVLYIHISQDFSFFLENIIYSSGFFNNMGMENGGAIYTDATNNNYRQLLINSDFGNNKNFYGLNNFGSSIFSMVSKINSIYSGENYLFQFSILDTSNNIANIINGVYNITINQYSNFNDSFLYSTNVTCDIISGEGTFLFTFYGSYFFNYKISIPDFPQLVPLEYSLKDCAQYKYYNSSFNYYNGSQISCNYCPYGYTLSGNSRTGECTQCSKNKLVCQDSNVYTNDGYFMLEKNPNLVYSCTIDTCSQNNTCNSEFAMGDLCYSCFNYFIENYQDIENINYFNSTSKNGIQCCKYFNPFLLIPMLLIYITMAFTLSILKYNNSIILKHTIIFLQINSIIFFSYDGVFILSIFRLSIDFIIKDYCYFENFNYIFKSIITYGIIVSLFIIGSSDITINTFKLIQNIQLKFKRNRKSNKRILRTNSNGITINNHNNNLMFENLINQIDINKRSHKENFKLKSIYNLIQYLFIPLLFNSLSLIIFKQKTIFSSNTDNFINQNLLAMDFSVNYLKSKLHLSFFIISITILSILLLQYLNLFYKFAIKSNPSKNDLKLFKLFNNQFKYKFKWFELLIILKSTIFTFLSLIMLFYPKFYLTPILCIQIFYSILFTVINPIKIKNNENRKTIKTVNLINLIQIIILLITNSNLFNILNSKQKGYIISNLIIISIIFIIILNLLIYKKKNLNKIKI